MSGATVAGTATTYAYDGDDTRVAKTVGGTPTNYVWDRESGLPLLVDDGTNAYLHSDGGLTQINGVGTPEYLLGDALGSRRGVTSLAGTLTGTADYDTFGAVRASNGNGSVFGYTGEQFDAETGYTYLHARYLNPSLGRFTSADSVQPSAPGTQGYNLYAYVANNPATWVDPSGHEMEIALADVPMIRAMQAMLNACAIYISGCAGGIATAWSYIRTNIIDWVGPAVGALGVWAMVCALITPCREAGLDFLSKLKTLDKPGTDTPPREGTGTGPTLAPKPKELPCIPGVPPCSIPNDTGTETGEDTRSQDPCERLGKFVWDNAAMSWRSKYYQWQITLRWGVAFKVGKVRFDGCSSAGVLLEAKACSYASFLGRGFPPVVSKLLRQANNQETAARAVGGAPIEWHFAEKRAAELMSELLTERGSTITVLHTEPIFLYNTGIPSLCQD